MKVHDVIAERKPLDDVVRVCREGIAELTQVPSNRTGERPRVGIVGEIYVRSNRYANNDVVREVERLGGEVWMPPIAEWFLYTNHTRKMDARVRSDYRTYLKNVLTEWVQMKDEHKIAEPFKDVLINFHEPPIAETIAAAAKYVHSSFEGEAILSIGKSVDFARNELDGVINVMPFTCMPGTIVSAILKKFKAENDNIPVLNMAYDGLEESNDVARLEAFIYQAKQFKERRERKKKGREKQKITA
jgi:predicted nucleotide-binding protein (sugar kinase/HSP70/actin superfamily)